MRKRLVDENYFVLYADALDYINPALPIQISDLLIVLAGAFSELWRLRESTSVVNLIGPSSATTS